MVRFVIALLFEVLVLERSLAFAKERREDALAGRRRRRRKRCRSRRGCTCGGGSRVALEVGVLQRAQPGIEPGPDRPKRSMLPLHHQAQ